ncbi:MAG: UbiA family prenyltransferase [Candidatus Thermoplasmatota archaeon]|jgi:geranylgeranylglycerol-phosphate geranylgeranyltransferase|nr:UbiA family prenyltransferase [Candidatus Thermoplasmatota archaeon]MCL5793526.1 UbiA family prenyltransferase [Candidatus Thermoplasmatota archaeon]
MNRWIAILRPVNGVMGIAATWISAFIAVGFGISAYLVPVSIGSAIVFMVTSGGNIFNDYLDIETDRMNHPQRPLPKGEIKKENALAAGILLFLVSPILSFIFISFISLAVVAAAEIVLLLYEIRTKHLGLTGNLSVSVLVGLIFIFGGISVNSVSRMVLLFFMAVLANLSREVIKDIEDMEGDVDRMTFPKSHGLKSARIVASVSVLSAIAVSLVPYLLSIFGIEYLIAVLVADATFIASLLLMPGNVSRSQNVSKLAMIFGLASFAIGGLF